MSQWKIYDEITHYFCTMSISSWYPVFTELRYFNIITDSLSFCRSNKGLNIHGYVIMLNHIHLIVSANKEVSVSNVFRDFKRFTSGEISMLLKKSNRDHALEVFEKAATGKDSKNNYKIWQDGFHPIALINEPFYIQKLDYIHQNPVKKGYVVKPEHWVYSSASNYAGQRNVALEIDCLRP